MVEKKWFAGQLRKERWGSARLLSVAMLNSALVLGTLLCLGSAGPSLQQNQIVAEAPKPDEKPVVLAVLPLKIIQGQTSAGLARRLALKNTFMALALSVESVPASAYVDAAGANAGAGYCVDARRRVHGEIQVENELRSAGFSTQDVKNLMSRNNQKIESVTVGPEQALRLLAITKPQYEALARNALGAKAFGVLPEHKRDVLSYLAYNTGSPKKFVKLIRAVKSGDDIAALTQLAPSVRSHTGKNVKNHRLRAWAQAAWIGPSELAKAISKPVEFEKSYAGKMGQEKFIKAHMAFFSATLVKKHIDELVKKKIKPKQAVLKKRSFR